MGVAILAAVLKSHGYEVQILDLNLWMLRTAQVFGRGGMSFDYKNNLQWRLRTTLLTFQPDIVGVSVMFTMQHEAMKQILAFCKKGGYRTMAGGVHVSNAPEMILTECKGVLDYLCLYESERSLPALLNAINFGTATAWHEVGQVIENFPMSHVPYEKRLMPEAKDIPAPDYCGIELADYEDAGQVGTYRFLRERTVRASSSLSTRGCRAKCTFCSVRSFNGPGVRKREVEAVVDEIQSFCEKDGIGHITWLDDDLLFDRRRALALFNEITARRLAITWDASNGLIAAAIDAELLDAMVASGCVGFNLGIESGSPEILRSVKKPGTVERYLQCAELLKKYPQLFVKAFMILGFLGETLKQIKQSVDLVLQMGVDWSAWQTLNPLPSTEIFRSMADQGLLEDGKETNGRGFMAGIFSSLNQRAREEAQKADASQFFDLLSGNDLDHVPDKADLADLWFIADYRSNYFPIFDMAPGPKLENKRKMLLDVCDRVTKDNPLGNYFLSVIEMKGGDLDAAHFRARECQKFLNESEYWQRRFETLGIEA